MCGPGPGRKGQIDRFSCLDYCAKFNLGESVCSQCQERQVFMDDMGRHKLAKVDPDC